MKKKLSSQWDFDDLFSLAEKRKRGSVEPVSGTDDNTEPRSGAEPQSQSGAGSDTVPEKPQGTGDEVPSGASVVPDGKPLTVGQLTAQIRSALENQYRSVCVTGEVTNLRFQSSGHVYFSIKDRAAQLQCVLFRGQRGVDRELLEDGSELILRGSVTVYEARGQYQLLVQGLEPVGVGALQAAFEKLKRKLQAEGLFDEERKRPLPAYMSRVGLVTSPTGAAIRDVLHVISRRFPGLELFFIPCRVQGSGAGAEIAAAIRQLNEFHQSGGQLDAILVTRGGGSLEDLWAFNEETVARAIADSQLPVIAAVGHEIDFTIADFVADYRAATPSAAAEVITESFVRAREAISVLVRRTNRVISSHFRALHESLDALGRRLERRHPRRLMEQNFQQLDELSLRFSRTVRRLLDQKARDSQVLARQFQRTRPSRHLREYGIRLQRLETSLKDQAHRRLADQRLALVQLEERLRLLSPQAVLDRGYSIALKSGSDGNRSVLRHAGDVDAGEEITVILASGQLKASVLDASATDGHPES